MTNSPRRSRAHRRFSSRSQIAPLLVLLGALGTACSGGSEELAASGTKDPKAASGPGVDRKTPFGIHVRMGQGPTAQERVFKPELEVMGAPGELPAYWPASIRSAPGARTAAVKSPGFRVQSGGAGGSSPAPNSQVDSDSIWQVVRAAAGECGVGAPPPGATAYSQTLASHPAVVPSWGPIDGGGDAFSIFQTPPASCEDVLAQAQAVLCTADKLLEVADAVGPITWSTLSSAQLVVPEPAWVIPPQAEQDKFIVRDMALHLLANVAVIDMTVPTAASGPDLSHSCADLLAQAAADLQFATTNAELLFGVPVTGTITSFPPEGTVVDGNSVTALASSRLLIETHVLRAAGRLLKTTVAKSTQSDFAQAQARASRALDAVTGQKLAWGTADTTSPSYNSLAHAMRAAVGRLELGAALPVPPPPGGIVAPPSEVLQEGYGGDLNALVALPPILSPGQEQATRFVEASGIALPTTALATLSGADAKQLVLTQALGAAAVAHGLLADDAQFQVSLQATAIKNIVGEMSESDILFALGQTNAAYRLRTNSVDVSASTNFLTTAAHTSAQIAALDGVVVKNGISVSARTEDPFVRIGNVASLSQSTVPQGVSPLDPDKTFGEAFQGVYPLSGVLYRRVVKVREAALAAGLSQENTAGSVASAAAAELRGWAGVRRSVLKPLADGRIQLDLLGQDAHDLGDTTTLADHIVMVRGKPWVAECAEGARQDCPANFEAQYVLKPSSVVVESLDDNAALRRSYAADGYHVTLIFDPTTGAGSASAAATSGATYVVNTAVANTVAVLGETMAVFNKNFPDADVSVWTVKSQDTVMNLAGITNNSREHRVGSGSEAAPLGSCLGPGQSPYIPIENELTSDGDPFESSWKYYLNRARASAAKADQLGRQLLDLNTQKENRREGALEGLAALCGDYAAGNGILGFDKGVPLLDPSDEALNLCVREPTYDLVFLSKFPPQVEAGGETAINYLRQFLGCPPAAQPQNDDLCKKLTPQAVIITDNKVQPQQNSPGLVFVGSLGLGEFEGQSYNPSNCLELGQSMQAVSSSAGTSLAKQTLVKAAYAEYASKDTLAKMMPHVKLTRQPEDGEWKLEVLGSVVMNSRKSSTLWPGCLRFDAEQQSCDPSAELFADLFMEGATRHVLGSCSPTEIQIPGTAACISRLSFVDVGQDNLSDVQKLGLLMWRVQGALVFLSRYHGDIPDGMFQVPMSYANFDFVAWDGLLGGVADFASMFGYSHYELMPDQQTYVLKNDPAKSSIPYSDFYALPLPVPSDTVAPVVLKAGGNREVPPWIVKADTDASRYVRSKKPVSIAKSNLSIWDGAWNLNTSVANAAWLKGVIDLFASGDASIACSTSGGGVRLAGFASNETDSHRKAWQEITFRKSRAIEGTANNLRCGNYFSFMPTDNGFNGAEDARFCYSADYFQSWFADSPISLISTYPNPFSFPKDPVQQPHQALLSGYMQGVGYENNLSQVAQLFTNVYPPAGACSAYAHIVQALGLACHFSKDPTVPQAGPPPEISDLSQLPALGAWLAMESSEVHRSLGRVTLRNVPGRVVSDFQKQAVGTGPIKGEHGATILQFEQSLQEMYQSWVHLGNDVRALGDAVKSANIQIASADLSKDTQLGQLALQSISIHQAQTQALIQVVGSLSALGGEKGGVNPMGLFSVASAGLNALAVQSYGNQQLDQIAALEGIAGKQEANAVAAALLQLNQTNNQLYGSIQTSLSSIRISAGNAIKAASALDLQKQQATHEMAKAKGQDFVTMTVNGVPKQVDIGVNRVLNRDYDITRARYEAALGVARRYACISRLSIEQRLGVHLNSIKDPITSAQEAPLSWADLSNIAGGLDYEAGACSKPDADPLTCLATLSQTPDVLARQEYIGDYVDRLEQFVDEYGISFPFHEGDDSAVLSLSEDILAKDATCVRDASNLFYYSSQAYACVPTSSDSSQGHGWHLTGCATASSGSTCLVVGSADMMGGLQEPNHGPLGASMPASWLVLKSFAAGEPVPSDASGCQDTDPSAPANTLYQELELSPGRYVLSWWAQARTQAGQLIGAPAVPYSVRVAAKDWSPVANDSVVRTAFSVADPLPEEKSWGDRQTLVFEIVNQGTYRVAFTPGVAGTATMALAGLQLEAVSSATSAAGPYEGTSGDRRVVTGEGCKGDPADLRAAFSYTCDGPLPGRCFYKLERPIFINLGDAPASSKDASGSLLGKLAQGSQNYRHVSIALNLVGTNVHDCSGASGQSCYGSSYEAYVLKHQAPDVKILNPVNGGEVFDFGTQPVLDGKALAAEKFITLPLSGADQSLLAQPGIERTELRGRPLDGRYELWIADSPSLRWDRLEDIQLYLKYRYWTNTTKGDGFSH